MTQATLDLAQYADQKVTLTFRQDDGEEVTKEGRVDTASAAGLLFKEKGKADLHIITPEAIVGIEVAPTKDPKVTVKKLQPIPLGRVRQHLADRHGYRPADLNAMSEQQAFDLHEQLDHTELAHKHEVPAAKAEATEDDSED